MIVVSRPVVRKENEEVVISAQVKSGSLPAELWFSYPLEYYECIDEESADWLLAGLLVPAMLSGEDLNLTGSVSSLLLHSAQTELQQVLSIQNKNLKPIRICGNISTVSRREIGSGIATAFSAGIDTFATLSLIEHSNHSLTHLTSFNVGAHGSGDPARQLHLRYRSRLEEYCAYTSHASLSVDSNLQEFYQSKFVNHIRTHTIKNVAAMMPIQKNFGIYFYSSSYDYRSIGVKNVFDISFTDPIILPLLSTENMQVRAYGTSLSRLEKIRLVSELKDSYIYLDVCVDSAEKRLGQTKINCGICWKCARTILTLKLLNKDYLYSDIFDFQAFESNKEAMIYGWAMKMLTESFPGAGINPNDGDVLTLAQSLGILPKISFENIVRWSGISWKLKIAICKYITYIMMKNI